MKKAYVSTLMVILFSAILVSFSYAGASYCDPGSGCCGTPNNSGGQQQERSSSAGSSQTKVVTAKKPPQINTMPWSATTNQIGGLQRPFPAISTGLPGTACCSGTNSVVECCGNETRSGLPLRPDASAIIEILAFSPFMGTLW
jgi:hypothetical protein